MGVIAAAEVVFCQHLRPPQTFGDVLAGHLQMDAAGVRGVRFNFVKRLVDATPREHFIEVAERMIHEAGDGKKYLVIHGDEFDVVVRNARLLAYLGDWAYDAAIALNIAIAAVRRRIGLPYWSFSAWAKLQVKHAVNFIGEFQRVVAEEARRNNVDGVICGHIHHAEIRQVNGIDYLNCGDWVESCTALIEHQDGRIELYRWDESTAAALEPVADALEGSAA